MILMLRDELTRERAAEIAGTLRAFFGGDAKRWTQKALARKADGAHCHPKDAEAVCWCLDGAAMLLEIDALDLRRALRPHLPESQRDWPFWVWQDAESVTFADVEAVLARVEQSE